MTISILNLTLLLIYSFTPVYLVLNLILSHQRNEISWSNAVTRRLEILLMPSNQGARPEMDLHSLQALLDVGANPKSPIGLGYLVCAMVAYYAVLIVVLCIVLTEGWACGELELRKVGNKPVGKSGGPTIKKQVGKLDGAVGGIERAEKSEGGK